MPLIPPVGNEHEEVSFRLCRIRDDAIIAIAALDDARARDRQSPQASETLAARPEGQEPGAACGTRPETPAAQEGVPAEVLTWERFNAEAEALPDYAFDNLQQPPEGTRPEARIAYMGWLTAKLSATHPTPAQEAPDASELESWRATADDLLRNPASMPTVRRAAFLSQNAYLSWTRYAATAPQEAPADDPADIIAGALQTSRAHAYALMRQAVAAQEAPQAETPAPVMRMRICEATRLVLRLDQPYVFTEDPECPSCKAAADQAREAYGPNGGAPQAPQESAGVPERQASGYSRPPNGEPCNSDDWNAGYEAGLADGKAQVARAEPAASPSIAAFDSKALETAREISLMWGQSRSQFVSRIQVAVRDAMQWAARAEPVDPHARTVAWANAGKTWPWPTVTRYTGGAAPDGVAGRVWLRLEDSGPDVEYVRAEPAGGRAIPHEAISRLLAEAIGQAVNSGANGVSMPDDYVEIAAWLAQAEPAGGRDEREALQRLVDVLRDRFYGRMPDEVQQAFDAARASLAAPPSQRPKDTPTWRDGVR